MSTPSPRTFKIRPKKTQLAAEAEEISRYLKAEEDRKAQHGFIIKVYAYGLILVLIATGQGIVATLTEAASAWIEDHNYLALLFMWLNFFLLLIYIKVYKDLRKRRIFNAVFIALTVEFAAANFLNPVSFSLLMDLIYAAIITVLAIIGSLFMTFSNQADKTSMDIEFFFVWIVRSYICGTLLNLLAMATHSPIIELVVAVILILLQFLMGLLYGKALGVKQFYMENKNDLPMIVIFSFYIFFNFYSSVLMLIEAAVDLVEINESKSK